MLDAKTFETRASARVCHKVNDLVCDSERSEVYVASSCGVHRVHVPEA